MNPTSPALLTRARPAVPEAWFAVPGNLCAATGGYAYARALIAAMPEAGWRLSPVELPAGFPRPSAADLDAADRALGETPPGAPVLVDGLAYGVLPRTLLDRLDRRWVALVHHPLAQESGLSPAEAARLRASEREALAAAAMVVATSPHTAAALATDFGVPRHRLHVAMPGTRRVVRARGSGEVPVLLCVATVTVRKGHDVLVRALGALSDLPWRARLIGSLEREPATAARLREEVRAAGLEERIVLEGEVSAETLERAYAEADMFVLPSRHEGYGMAFAEAMAHGLPVIGCAVGAVPGTVPEAAGILVPPDDAQALAAALRGLLGDPASRRHFADAAWACGRALPTWHDTARAMAQALEAAS